MKILKKLCIWNCYGIPFGFDPLVVVSEFGSLFLSLYLSILYNIVMMHACTHARTLGLPVATNALNVVRSEVHQKEEWKKEEQEQE